MEKRGSEELIRHAFDRYNQQGLIAEDDVQWLQTLLQEEKEVHLVQFWIRGQPKPDTLRAILQVPNAQLGSVVQRIAEGDPLLVMQVLPCATTNPGNGTVQIDSFWGHGQPSVDALKKTKST